MTGRARASMVAVLTGVLLVAGCGARPDLAPDRGANLRAAVLEVTAAAAAGRWDAAEAALSDTRARLDAGVDAGDVSTTRYREIDQALDRVSEALVTARAEEAAAAAAAQQAAADQAAADLAAAQPAAAEQAAAQQGGPERAPAPKDKGPGKPKGPGKGKP